ncbi:MAG: tRNA pseudouridine(55) synthase TruB [Lachnospiraceae bacterium]|nr:tRNA pseudouridine(55) synthase TruB [Lachnospiraceae bacterium]
MYNGIININKEKGFTSHDVVAKLRRILGQKKIGHTGTLDPDATGVLPVCLGNGTKLSDMLTDTDKTYRAVFVLGKITDTQDISGEVIGGSDATFITEDMVRDAVNSFVGEYDQIPPMYSAIKQNGRKLYELARAGIEVERAARRITINNIIIELIDLPYVTITVDCSKGTYIRTLCHDIGLKLGCGACMTELTRVKVGIFELEKGLSLQQVEELCNEGKLDSYVIPADEMFPDYMKVTMLAPNGDKAVHNGNPFVEKDCAEDNLPKDKPIRVYDSSGIFIGVFSYRTEKKMFFPDKMFLL